MRAPRRIQTKILLSLAAVAALFVVSAWCIQEWTVLPSFRALEQQQSLSDLDRATEALRKEIEHVNDFVGDWSGWDDTYRFVQDGNAEYARSNLETNVFRDDSFDFICLLRLDGTEVWRDGLAPDGQRTRVEELPQGTWPADHPLLQPRGVEDARTGILLTSQGPLLVASRPVTDSARSAEPNGWILMGRFLHAERVRALARQTRLALEVLPSVGPLDERARAALARLRAGSPRDLAPCDEHTMQATAFLPDLSGTEGLLVRADLERSVLASGRGALDFALFTMLAAVAVVFGALLLLLRRIVVLPLATLTQHAVALGESDDLTRRCSLARDDELGILAREFDTMVGRLAESQAHLVDSARRGGMSEIATTVLHDVGNAMQGVQASQGALARRLDGRKLADLERVSGLLAEHAHELDKWLSEDPKGKRVPAFLTALTRSLVEEHAGLRGELGSLAGGLEHIRSLVAAQQQHTGQRGAIEKLDLPALLEEALRLTRTTGEETLAVERDFGPVPEVRAEKHRLLAVLVNLVRNARQAVQHLPAGEARLVLRLACGESGAARIAVEDNGQGIAPEDLQRIFGGGLTRKPDGHGIGLHGCANSVRELGGRLWAESEGPGRGARFLVLLPVHVPDGAQETR